MRLYCQCQETKKWRVKKKMKSLGVYLKHYKKESIIAPLFKLLEVVFDRWTIILSFCVGLMLSSAFPAILLYAQELLPNKLGLISGLFFGFAFGVAGIASAVLGNMADKFGIDAVYNVCAFMPLLGLVTWFLPDLKKVRSEKQE